MVPSCDLDRHHYANVSAFSFAIPESDSCHTFHYVGPAHSDAVGVANESAAYCNLDYFDLTTLDTCEEHVYDETEYHRSFVMDVDIAPCGDLPDWHVGTKSEVA